MLALSMTFVMAADNSIYIDQAGDNSTISVTQDGAGNTVRGIQGVGTGNTTPAIIRGATPDAAGRPHPRTGAPAYWGAQSARHAPRLYRTGDGLADGG